MGQDTSYMSSQHIYPPEDVKPKMEQLGTDSVPPPSDTSQHVSSSTTMDDDTKSDTSYDPLFDDAPDGDGEPDSETASQSAPSSQPPAPAPQFGMGYPQSSNPQYSTQQSLSQSRSSYGAIAPKNAPPVLDPTSYTSYSPDVLMVASIDGQIVLWDRRVSSPGAGVGRLWMSEKTPPWCVSVSGFL